MSDATVSPPFRDSDALRVIIKRLERIEQLMRQHRYGGELKAEMEEAAAWFEWLNDQITRREETR